MFTKLLLATLATLALSTFGSESAGRYRVEGPSNSDGASAQAGRYHIAHDTIPVQAQESWGQVGQSQVAGRYSQSQTGFATARAFNAPEAVRMTTQRAPAMNVSHKPLDIK